LLSRILCACGRARSGGGGGGFGDGGDGEVTLAVTGMSCASCSSKIQTTLQGLPFVANAVVNLLAEKAVVSFRSESMVGADEGVAKIVAAVTKLGFGAERLTAVQAGRVSLFVDGMVCASCPPRIECALVQLDGVQRCVSASLCGCRYGCRCGCRIGPALGSCIRTHPAPCDDIA